jgi:hypothetical protein
MYRPSKMKVLARTRGAPILALLILGLSACQTIPPPPPPPPPPPACPGDPRCRPDQTGPEAAPAPQASMAMARSL